jgi:hypothetical protein
MAGERQGKSGRKQAQTDARVARLGRALRTNLLKRKAQAKKRASSAKDGDGGRQS